MLAQEVNGAPVKMTIFLAFFKQKTIFLHFQGFSAIYFNDLQFFEGNGRNVAGGVSWSRYTTGSVHVPKYCTSVPLLVFADPKMIEN